MAMPFVSALPIRFPLPENDMAGMLASWIDNCPDLGLSSADCRRDLEKIDRLRRDIAQSLPAEQEAQSGLTEKLHQYYHFLLECEEQGMVQKNDVRDTCSSSSEHVALEWKSAVLKTGSFQIQTARCLESERANVMWNLAALQAQKASNEDIATKKGWTNASKFLQNAASWLGHLLVLLQEKQDLEHREKQFSDMSPTFVLFWQALLVAQAQQCYYESRCVTRPVHQLAAKLSAAAVPLYAEVERIAKTDENSPAATPAMSQCSDLVTNWTQFSRAWGAYMSSRAEYHQSHIHRDKKDLGEELARLDLAYQYAAICKNLCEESGPGSELLDEVRAAADEALKVILSRVDNVERESNKMRKQTVPKQQELTEIRGQKLVKCDEPLSKLLLPKTTESIFQHTPDNDVSLAEANSLHNGDYNEKSVAKDRIPILGSPPPPSLLSTSFLDQKRKATPVGMPSPMLQNYAEVFRAQMTERIEELARATESRTESARLALAEVHLPHSITAYKQEQSGGGLPEDLWQRVHIMQQDNKVMRLKQELWELKDAADLARATHQKILKQMDSDVEGDREFRKANQNFKGHDAGEVQGSFLKPLAKYDKLLSSAKDGDSVLFQRLEQLDIKPKYNLLQFSKSELDHLVPGAKASGGSSNITINTQHLSYLLSELKVLFQERANLMDVIRAELDNFDIIGVLKSKVDSTTGSDNDYIDATKYAQKTFDNMMYEIQNNMMRQDELLGTILSENEEFMNSRERTTNSQSADSCIVMIEDAIEEIDQLSEHLNEGKDFYNVVIPKLNELKHQVDNVSARLTVERLEYSENERRAKQEEKDALMAKKLSADESSSQQQEGEGQAAAAPAVAVAVALTTSSRNSSSPADAGDEAQGGSPPRSTRNAHGPSIPNPRSTTAASYLDPRVCRVDDGKVATLVAMDFDADKVVDALERHGNDMDEALNELLS